MYKTCEKKVCQRPTAYRQCHIEGNLFSAAKEPMVTETTSNHFPARVHVHATIYLIGGKEKKRWHILPINRGADKVMHHIHTGDKRKVKPDKKPTGTSWRSTQIVLLIQRLSSWLVRLHMSLTQLLSRIFGTADHCKENISVRNTINFLNNRKQQANASDPFCFSWETWYHKDRFSQAVCPA